MRSIQYVSIAILLIAAALLGTAIGSIRISCVSGYTLTSDTRITELTTCSVTAINHRIFIVNISGDNTVEITN